MSGYTEYLTEKEYRISPCNDDYTEKLIEAARSFRPFSEALDEFLIQHGYEGDITNVKSKINYLKQRFEAAGIPFDARLPKKWYNEGVRAEKRETAFKICFAFGLDIPGTQEFFRKVYLQRGIDCHDIIEAIYYFAIQNGLSYGEAMEIINKAPKAERENIDFDSDVLFTAAIKDELDRFRTADELLGFISDNISKFGYNNATAYKLIKGVWSCISADDGLADREEKLLFLNRKGERKKRSVWDIYKQIFGLEYYDHDETEAVFSLKKADRTLAPILKNNDIISAEAGQAFPDRQGLEGIINGEHKSAEVVRKTMILLVFYKFYASRIIKNGNEYCAPVPDDDERCRAEIDNYLAESGYPELYDGNPYDWIFLAAMRDDYPLDAFRAFMAEVYLNHQEKQEE